VGSVNKVVEREIDEPKMFDALEQAQAEMAKDFTQTMGIKAENADEIRVRLEADGYDAYDGVGFYATCACCERLGQNYDWKIFQWTENRWEAI